jgi:hypothetical protein
MRSTDSRVSRDYVSGLWMIEGNSKRSPAHYMEHLPETISMLSGDSLHFYSADEAVLATVDNLCRTHRVRLTAEHRPLDSLPAWNISQTLIECCRAMNLNQFDRPSQRGADKGARHYWRLLEDSGEEPQRAVLAIWLSKVLLMNERAKAAESATRELAWVDASISRFNNQRSNWDFPTVSVSQDRLCHYGSTMQYYGLQLPLNASFLCGRPSAWRAVTELYEKALQSAIKMPYGHDEETVLGHCVWEHPELFETIGSPLPRTEGKRSSSGIGTWVRRLRALLQPHGRPN